MRTNEERIAAMHARATELNKQHRARKVRVLQSAGATVALAATIMLAIFMPRMADFNATPVEGASDNMYASIFSDSGALGLIVIAIIAFWHDVAFNMWVPTTIYSLIDTYVQKRNIFKNKKKNEKTSTAPAA